MPRHPAKTAETAPASVLLATLEGLLAWIDAPEGDPLGMSYLAQRSCADVVEALSGDVADRIRAAIAAAKC